MPAAPAALASPSAASILTRPLPPTAPGGRQLRQLARDTSGLLIPDLAPPPPQRLLGDEPARSMLARLLADAIEVLCTTDNGELLGEALWYLFHDPAPYRFGGVAAVAEALDLDLPRLRRHLEAEAKRVGRWLDPEVCTLFASFARRRQAYHEYVSERRTSGKRSPRRARIRQLLPCVPLGYFVIAAPPIPYTLPVTHRGRAGRLAAGSA